MTEDEPPTAKALTKNPLGPSGKAVSANVERLRKEQNLTFAALSERLDDLKRPIPPLGLRKIVGETRRVDTDDLVGLAVALGVSPITLLMPVVEDPADEVEVTGFGAILAGRLWDWLIGVQALDYSGDHPDLMSTVFQSRARPKWALAATFGKVQEVPADVDVEVLNKVAQGAAAKAVQDFLQRKADRRGDGDD